MSYEEKHLARVSEAHVSPTSLDGLLDRIRPSWKSKNLISRVLKLVQVDPSSACQRLLNAAVQDLREKILVAGLDLAKAAANTHKLPSISKSEDILDSYSTSNILELAYRIGLVSRPEWKRLKRAYDIRRDLEHEDDEYEAQPEDCLYVFKSCIEIVLLREPREILRVDDVRDLIESPTDASPSSALLEDYAQAPEPRQIEILKYLVDAALNSSGADIVRQNAIETLREFQPHTKETVKIQTAQYVQERIKRRPLDLAEAKVAVAGGFLAYLKQSQVEAFFEQFHRKLEDVGHDWTHHPKHRDILDDLEDVGGLVFCPESPRARIVLWLTLCYLGEPGGYGTWGRNRKVFYSDVAALPIEGIFKTAGELVKEDLKAAKKSNRVKAVLDDKHIARRYEKLLDLVGSLTSAES